MVAVMLIHGYLNAECYENQFAQDPRIDNLRAKMKVHEEQRFTQDYYDPDKCAIGNSVQVFFRDGTSTGQVSIDFPIGHRRRRKEAIPLLEQKLSDALATRFPSHQAQTIYDLCSDRDKLEEMPMSDFMDMLVI
jgi:2-methylcitrate dehydratase